MKRRELLKALGTAAIAPSIVPTIARAGSPDLGKDRTTIEPAEEIPSLCDMCLWRCGILAKVRDGEIIRVRGNPDHPRNKGKLCARGIAGRYQVTDPDRLKYPLLRAGKRGEGKWKRISWDEALDLWASKTAETIEKHGPGSIGLFSHGLSSRFMNAFMLHIGNPNRAVPSFGQCRGPRDVGFELTFGEGPGSPERHDMARSKMIVLVGSHIGENIQTGQVAEFSEAIDNGARLVVVDPRMSVSASKADSWLSIRPGTDTALLLAWINLLLTEELYDKDYIDRYATGLDELRRSVHCYTPDWAADTTQIPRDVIVAEAREMARRKPDVLIHCGRFSAWYGNDTQRSRAMAILVALLGSWGRPGGYYLRSDIDLGPLPCPKRHGEMAESVATGQHAFTRFGVASQEIVEASLGEDARIKQWVLYGVNPIQSLPDPRKTREAMQKVDFITMVDIAPTEGALWADLILPEATYLERHDDILAVKDHPQPFVALRQPVVPPRFEAKDPYWIARRLAHRLGHTDCFVHPDVKEYLDATLAPLGISRAQLAQKGIHLLDEQHPYINLGEEIRFKTPSGKIELYSEIMQRKGYHPVPIFEPVSQPPMGWFRLVAGRSPYHSFARTQNIERLMRKDPQNVLWVNEGVVRAKGLSDGDEVFIENKDGVRTGPIRILATPAIRTDAVYSVHGFGCQSHAMKRAHGRGISDNSLTRRFKADPPTGSTGFRVNFVRFTTRDGKEIKGETDACRVERSTFKTPLNEEELFPAPRHVDSPKKDNSLCEPEKDTLEFEWDMKDSC